MSLRDYFAAQALAYFPAVEEIEPDSVIATRLAKGAYLLADAMLAERNK